MLPRSGRDAVQVRRSYAPKVDSTLGHLATGCQLLTRTRGLADWVGSGRPVTPKGVLRPADVPAAASAIGVSVPARIRTAADLETIHRPWTAAQALGLVRVGTNRAVAGRAVEG